MTVLFQEGKISNISTKGLFSGALFDGTEYSISYSLKDHLHDGKCYVRGDGFIYLQRNGGTISRFNVDIDDIKDFKIQMLSFVGETNFCREMELHARQKYLQRA
jgi:hypothetical protein